MSMRGFRLTVAVLVPLSLLLSWTPLVAAEGHSRGGELEVRWTLLENATDGQSHHARWAITNHGSTALPSHGWTLYFNMLQMVSLNPILEISPTVTITHFSGDLFKLRPTDAFPPLQPGMTFTFEYWGVGALNKVSWAPEGLYIVFENERGKEERPSVIGKVTIDSFRRPEQINRGDVDRKPIPTPAYLHSENSQLSLLPRARVGKITPTPLLYRELAGELEIGPDCKIHHAVELQRDARYLARMLKAVFGRAPQIEAGTQPQPGAIVLKVASITVAGKAAVAGSEAYALSVDPRQGVVIAGADADGVFYGIQTLLQLLPPDAFAGRQATAVLPSVQIEDAPRFAYRGQHIDVSHNFHSKKSILRLLDRMAFYKLNTFHFQVSDDEGWRIEIPELPELTEIGGGRGHTRNHDGVLHPTYGTGPFREADSYGSGFYTRQDYTEIIRHARDLHIDVIPEINVPAHARAALIAMKVREERLMAAGKTEEALAYRLHEIRTTRPSTSRHKGSSTTPSVS